MKKNTRSLKFSEAVLEATDMMLQEDGSVILMGLGVTDPMGIFGTTTGLSEKYPKQVIETPTAENGTMGIAIGSALVGLRPIITHQRVEFALLAIEQITNQAAKWYYMTGGLSSMPIVVRLIVGRGWGQGPQHSQSLDSWFAHVPGLKVVAPANAYDAKGLCIAAIRDNNPVVIIEHRWLHNTFGDVPEEAYETPIGKAKIARRGKDLTIVSYSYMVTEALMAAAELEKHDVDVEVIDLRSYRPLDIETIEQSVQKTGRLITLDNGWIKYGIGAEIISTIVAKDVSWLKASPVRLGIEDVPIPSSRGLANEVYPGQKAIVEAVGSQLGLELSELINSLPDVSDIPNKSFTGPF
jgi:acetoin:2,6-dichlorophenolindophenol oxidoreductase subunit beta